MTQMPKTKTTLLLTLASLALLSGCDDNGGQDQKTSWFEWLQQKDEPKGTMVAVGIPSYSRETLAGTFLAEQFAQYRQDWKTAGTYLDKLVKLDPSNIDLQQRSMVLAVQGGDVTRAVSTARKVLEQDKKNLLALMFVGMDEMAQQNYAQSINTLSKMPENGVADFLRPILIAWNKASENKVDEPALIEAGPLHAYHALLIADYLGKVENPEKYFVNVVTGGGADKHILEMMADVFERQGDQKLADKIYDSLLPQKSEPQDLSSREQFIEEKKQQPEKAGSSRIQTPAQGAAEAFYNISRVLYQDQSDDSALVFIRLALYLDPAKEDAKMLLASMMIKADHDEDAIALYQSIKPGAPGYPEAQRSAAELMVQNGKIDEAISFLEDKFTQEKDIRYLVQIGDIYRGAERYPEAIKVYDRAIETLGGRVSAQEWNLLYARGMSYERSGNLDRAEKDLEQALEFQPNHPYLLNYLGFTWADQGKKLDKAQKLIEKAVALKPDDGYIIDSLGWVYYKLGRYEDAAKELEKAIELVPYDPTINDHLGDAYWQVGRKQEARFQWQRALNHTKVESDKPALEEKIASGLILKKDPVIEAKSHTDKDKDVKPQ